VTIHWLHRALEESRARGFLGPQPIELQVEHAEGFIAAWSDCSSSPPRNFLDLGSGGGLPGLVLLDRWQLSATLVDSMRKRTQFLIEVLGWDGAPAGGHVRVGRAEELARESWGQQKFDMVTARSFGPPAVTAECAARFLSIGGYLIVSEPPDDGAPSRWNSAALGQLGLHIDQRVRRGAAFQILRKVRDTPERYPRAIGVPGKNPLF
jgi:16S rRNA (guanine527-N7)-methyltransferase